MGRLPVLSTCRVTALCWRLPMNACSSFLTSEFQRRMLVQAPLEDLEADWGGGICTADKWIGIVYPVVY